MKYRFTFFLIFNSLLLFSQKVKNVKKLQQELEIIKSNLENTVSSNWFIQVSESTITLTYCKTCQELYIAHLDSLEKEFYRKKDNDELVNYYKGEPFYKIRNNIFKSIGPDSVSFYGTLSQCPRCDNSDAARKRYYPEDILEIKIDFRKEWSLNKIKKTQQRNDELKDEFLSTPLLKIVVDFDDYRAFIPPPYHKDRIKNHDYYFELLPYKSKIHKYAIFVYSTKKEITTATLLVDKKDDQYFAKQKNYIEKERIQTMLLISYVLQLDNYKIID